MGSSQLRPYESGPRKVASSVKLFMISNSLNTTILAVDSLHFSKRKWQSLKLKVGLT